MLEEDNKNGQGRIIKELQELALDGGYVLKIRLKEFTNGNGGSEMLSFDLYKGAEFSRSLCLYPKALQGFIKALRSIERQLCIVEPICGNCYFWRTDACWFGRGAPILKTDRFPRTCDYFVPKTQKHKLRKIACLTRHMLRHGLTEEEKKESDRYITDVTEGRIARKLENGYYLVK